MPHADRLVTPRSRDRGRVWLAALALMLSPAAADAGLVLEITSSSGTVAAGSPVTFTVVLRSTDPNDPATDISSFNLKLGVAGVVGAGFSDAVRPALGDYLFGSNTDPLTFTANSTDFPPVPAPFPSPVPGVFLADVSQNDHGGGVFYDTLPGGGSRQLAVLTVFTPAGAGGQLRVDFANDSTDPYLTDPNTDPIPVGTVTGAEVTVTPTAAVPAPPAAGLLAVGAALVPAFRRWGLRR